MMSRPAVVINGISSLSVLQLAYNEGKDCRIEVITSEGEGVFLFKDQNLITAFLGEESGIQAVIAFLKANNPAIRIFYTSEHEAPINIHMNFNSLILKSCQMLDEAGENYKLLLST